MSPRSRVWSAVAAVVFLVVGGLLLSQPIGLDVEIPVEAAGPDNDFTARTQTAQCRPVADAGFPLGDGAAPDLSDSSLAALPADRPESDDAELDQACSDRRLGRLLQVGVLAVPMTVLLTLTVLSPWRAPEPPRAVAGRPARRSRVVVGEDAEFDAPTAPPVT